MSGTGESSGLDDSASIGDSDSEGLCAEVIRDVWLFLDDELDADRRTVVQMHLIECAPCLDETELGGRLKALLHRTCGGDTAPEALRSSVITALWHSEHSAASR